MPHWEFLKDLFLCLNRNEFILDLRFLNRYFHRPRQGLQAPTCNSSIDIATSTQGTYYFTKIKFAVTATHPIKIGDIKQEENVRNMGEKSGKSNLFYAAGLPWVGSVVLCLWVCATKSTSKLNKTVFTEANHLISYAQLITDSEIKFFSHQI